MRILLDTHAFIWSITAPEKLSQQAQQAFNDSNNSLYISLISLWEIIIKEQIGKLKLGINLQETLAEQQEINDIRILPLSFEHLLVLSSLPLHHRDPFDRALIAQAITESMTLVTRDALFNQYPVSTLW